MQQLYTQKDITTFRTELAKAQKNIDPITQEKFVDAVALDHDHVSMKCRAALNRNSNSFEGVVTNAYLRYMQWLTDKPLTDLLRNLADYLEKDYSKNPIHPGWIQDCKSQFHKLNEKQKQICLESMKLPIGLNSKERKETFRKALLSREYDYTSVKLIILLSKGHIL